MCNRRHLALSVLTLLCFQAVGARAGSIGYEALDGNRCTVTTDEPSQLEFNSGYNEWQGANASFGVTVPLGDRTAKARANCLKFARLDQRRQHFDWLLDLYDQGVIDRQALQAEASKLGITLSPESSSRPGGMSILLEP